MNSGSAISIFSYPVSRRKQSQVGIDPAPDAPKSRLRVGIGVAYTEFGRSGNLRLCRRSARDEMTGRLAEARLPPRSIALSRKGNGFWQGGVEPRTRSGGYPPKIRELCWRDFREPVRGASPPYSETEFGVIVGWTEPSEDRQNEPPEE